MIKYRILVYNLSISNDNNESDKSKIIIHWSAGIGRTGTLIAVYNWISSINHYIDTQNIDKGKLSIFAIVRRLREQRYLLYINH